MFMSIEFHWPHYEILQQFLHYFLPMLLSGMNFGHPSRRKWVENTENEQKSLTARRSIAACCLAMFWGHTHMTSDGRAKMHL